MDSREAMKVLANEKAEQILGNVGLDRVLEQMRQESDRRRITRLFQGEPRQ